MLFLVMIPYSRDFLLMSLHIYGNKIIMTVVFMSAWFLDSELSTYYTFFTQQVESLL